VHCCIMQHTLSSCVLYVTRTTSDSGVVKALSVCVFWAWSKMRTEESHKLSRRQRFVDRNATHPNNFRRLSLPLLLPRPGFIAQQVNNRMRTVLHHMEQFFLKSHGKWRQKSCLFRAEICVRFNRLEQCGDYMYHLP
jgi:hypothetical protein